MRATSSAEPGRGQVAKPLPCPALLPESRMVLAQARAGQTSAAQHSYVDLGDSVRVALMVAPRGRGAFREQALEVLSAMQTVLALRTDPMVVTVLTVFLKDWRDQAECARLIADSFHPTPPVTNYVLQSPCCGAALMVEAWAIGGKSVRVERFGPHALSVAYDSVRWVYCAGIEPAPAARDVYAQTVDVLAQLRAALTQAGSSFERVVRTWFYLGGITEPEAGGQRYQELNRARSDFYRDIRFNSSSPEANRQHVVYPASTGIGMDGRGLVGSCMALETQRKDIRLLPLENPQQTPAYAYSARYSSQSPKFSRAVALALGHYVTTWVSGTASIVDSETRYPGDVARQTEQTIDNIERLIAAENFTRHGLKGAGAGLQDLAKIRVYLKRHEDLADCKAVCERRFGAVPAIYALADVCRPDLLVEIEGVAFSRYAAAEAS
jgi:enamine deaminase RidA (YjgF/YER057c/UK114 family)